MKIPKSGPFQIPLENSYIDVWYFRGVRMWVVQTKDTEGNQTGESTYTHSRGEAVREALCIYNETTK